MRALVVADASALAFGVIIVLCIFVMLVPFVGIGYVLFDGVRRRSRQRREAAGDVTTPEGLG